ncbi:hypothetical protein HMPREF3196_00600 [Bifidobacterium bifidum]|uniref:Uncharacterized protein n=1 Tax=Bifidobacterium bifidum TaxID=1681 RepID=A0A133KR59_BIFBI|nr:hypothetical protein HMPREF3196_00600 [Bifidobacterium bifidum]
MSHGHQYKEMRCIGAVKSRSAGAMSRMANSGSRVRRPSNYRPEGPANSYLAPAGGT